jgi:hypothetical protein
MPPKWRDAAKLLNNTLMGANPWPTLPSFEIGPNNMTDVIKLNEKGVGA